MEKEVHLMNTDPESGRRRRQNMIKVWSRIFLQAFTLTFLAEWGDRSQLTTIVLAAREVCISSSESLIQTCLKALNKAFPYGYGKTMFVEMLSITNLFRLSSKGITWRNGDFVHS